MKYGHTVLKQVCFFAIVALNTWVGFAHAQNSLPITDPDLFHVKIKLNNPGYATYVHAQNPYNKSLVSIFQVDDSPKTVYNLMYPYFKGGTTAGGYVSQGIKSTDGCGNDLFWTMSIACFIQDINGTDLLTQGNPYISWNELSTVTANGAGLQRGFDYENHAFGGSDVLQKDRYKQIYLNNKAVYDHLGFHPEGLVIPDTQIGFRFGANTMGMDVASQAGVEPLKDGATPLAENAYTQDVYAAVQNPYFFRRNHWQETNTAALVTEHKAYILNAYNRSQIKPAIYTWFSHGPGETGTSNFEYYRQVIDYMRTLAGDNVIGLSLSQFLGYQKTRYAAEHGTNKESHLTSDGYLDITFDMKDLKSTVRNRLLSLLVNSDAQIQSIEYSGNIKAVTFNPSTGLVNIQLAETASVDPATLPVRPTIIAGSPVIKAAAPNTLEFEVNRPIHQSLASAYQVSGNTVLSVSELPGSSGLKWKIQCANAFLSTDVVSLTYKAEAGNALDNGNGEKMLTYSNLPIVNLSNETVPEVEPLAISIRRDFDNRQLATFNTIAEVKTYMSTFNFNADISIVFNNSTTYVLGAKWTLNYSNTDFTLTIKGKDELTSYPLIDCGGTTSDPFRVAMSHIRIKQLKIRSGKYTGDGTAFGDNYSGALISQQAETSDCEYTYLILHQGMRGIRIGAANGTNQPNISNILIDHVVCTELSGIAIQVGILSSVAGEPEARTDASYTLNNVTISNITIKDGLNGANIETSGAKYYGQIMCRGINHLTLQDIDSDQNQKQPYFISSCKNVLADRCKATNFSLNTGSGFKAAFQVESSEIISIQNCFAQYTFENLYISGSTGIRLYHNTFDTQQANVRAVSLSSVRLLQDIQGNLFIVKGDATGRACIGGTFYTGAGYIPTMATDFASEQNNLFITSSYVLEFTGLNGSPSLNVRTTAATSFANYKTSYSRGQGSDYAAYSAIVYKDLNGIHGYLDNASAGRNFVKQQISTVTADLAGSIRTFPTDAGAYDHGDGSTNADLAILTTSSGTLSPVFAAATTGYTVSVANTVSSLTLTPTVAQANATVKVNGISTISGAASESIPLAVGANTITTTVTAQDGTTIKTYTVTVSREPTPSIISFTPSSGPVGTLVTINGTNLGNPETFNIGGAAAIVISNTGTSLLGMVMPGASNGTVSVSTSAGSVSSTTNFSVLATPNPSGQQGNKLVGNDSYGTPEQGGAVAISADGNTAIIGGFNDNSPSNPFRTGSVWIYTRSNGIWSQQGSKLVGTGDVGFSQQGIAVGISADGNTAIIGGSLDNSAQGATWIFVRNGNSWTQQGPKLIGTGSIGAARQGRSVGLSADGNTAIIGGYADNSNLGAAWVFTRNGTIWVQQGNKLAGNSSSTGAQQGWAVAISADGNTTAVGGRYDNGNKGAVWVFKRNSGVWTQEGNKLTGNGATVNANMGSSVALNADGNTLVSGGVADNFSQGASWVFVRNNSVWAQQGTKLVGSGSIGASWQGSSVALSADGNVALIGGSADNANYGANWIFVRNGATWTQQGNKLLGNGNIGNAQQGYSVALSADGTTGIIGGYTDNSGQGAAWVFTPGTIPSITTTLVSTIGTTSAILGGNVVSDGGASVAERGVVYSISLNPTLLNTKIQIGSGTGTYTQNVSAFNNGTTYHVRAYAINSLGTAYGNDEVFTTLQSTNADLAFLALSDGILSPSFASITTNYTVSVAHTTSSVMITPTTADSTATIKVNGQSVISGSASGNIPLGVGSNNIVLIEVKAQDGTTIKNYTITISRPAPIFPYSESFKNSTASNVIYGGSALLTAGIDGEGAGYLRLTSNATTQSGYARSTRVFPSQQGLSASFEYYSHTGSGADGLIFYLYDATVSPFVAGSGGGSLGYTQNSVSGLQPGVSKGYLALGLDEFGNFSNPTTGKQGGPGQKASSAVLRGDGDGTSMVASNYEYLTGIQTNNAAAMSVAGAGPAFALAGAVNGRTGIIAGRPYGGGLTPLDNGYRKAKLELRPNGSGTGFIINVWITEGNAAGAIVHHVITDYSYISTGAVPATLSYGFAAATGGSTYFHEVRNLELTIPSGVGSQEPTVTDINKAGTTDLVVPFTATNFTSKFSSPNGIALTKIKVVSLPEHGKLKLGNTEIVAGQEIAFANLGGISFVPQQGFSGNAGFVWNGSDGTLYSGSTANVIISLSAAGSQAFPYAESFKNSIAEGLMPGGSASLTSGTADANGAGYLRLTSNVASQLGYARNTRGFPSADGFSISFDYYTYGGSGADGLSFFLYDATANENFHIGTTGGSLGYTQSTAADGLSKGFLGVGFDEFGNFSAPIAGHVKGPGQLASSVTLRGDGSGMGTGTPGGTNYEYLTNVQTSNSTVMSAAGAGNAFQIGGNVNGRAGGAAGLTPTANGFRRAKIELTPNGQGTGYVINVWITEGNAASPIEHHVITDYNYLPTTGIPANLSYGFAGATGGSTNYHEVRNLEIGIPGAVPIPMIMSTNAIAGNDELQVWGSSAQNNIPVSNKSAQEISEQVYVNASNILTPNSDGKNDTWVITNLEANNTVKIYDRNGRKVYEMKNYANDWDGTFQGAPLSSDTYYYIIESGQSKNQLKGFISIVR